MNTTFVIRSPYVHPRMKLLEASAQKPATKDERNEKIRVTGIFQRNPTFVKNDILHLCSRSTYLPSILNCRGFCQKVLWKLYQLGL